MREFFSSGYFVKTSCTLEGEFVPFPLLAECTLRYQDKYNVIMCSLDTLKEIIYLICKDRNNN